MPRKNQVFVINALREKTATGQRRIAEKQTANHEKAVQDDKKLQLQMKERAKSLFAECKKKAGAVADEGKSHMLVNVMQYGSEPYPKWRQYLTQYTRELLEKAGFDVKVKDAKMEPHGSDPLFPFTTYSTYLLISWDK